MGTSTVADVGSSTSTSGDGSSTGGGSSTGDAPEYQPDPADGDGVLDPPSSTLHNQCAGIDWQLVAGWVLHPHAAPELAPADEMDRCVERYAGWVTNDADAAGVSRASVYAALAATGQCDADHEYDGAMLSGAQCVLVHPERTEETCLAAMAESKAFGIFTLAFAIGRPEAHDAHGGDPPRIGAWLGQGAVTCGGDDRWKLLAPTGFVDHYVAAYNAYHARSTPPPMCAKRIVMSVALYTGMDTPGKNGVAEPNGCWTFERVTKSSAEWKICNYDGTVHTPDGWNWAYDDTNTAHVASQDVSRIQSCKQGTSGRGYVYMANRGSGWPARVTNGVAAHFAELYSGQYTVDDQFDLWKQSGKPGQPMLNFGEAGTGASKIGTATTRACHEVADGGWFGVYVYPEPLRAARMSAMVEALDACTGV